MFYYLLLRYHFFSATIHMQLVKFFLEQMREFSKIFPLDGSLKSLTTSLVFGSYCLLFYLIMQTHLRCKIFVFYRLSLQKYVFSSYLTHSNLLCGNSFYLSALLVQFVLFCFVVFFFIFYNTSSTLSKSTYPWWFVLVFLYSILNEFWIMS